jgi:3-methylcrotonyl-CoA carboxylase alpha subunit
MIKGTDTQADILNQSIKAQVLQSGNKIQVHSSQGTSEFIKSSRLTIHHNEEENDHGLHAPMNGCLTEVRVKTGDQVIAGDILVIMEAMKMEHSIKAPCDGLIDQVFFNEGDLVDEGSEILSFVAEDKA